MPQAPSPTSTVLSRVGPALLAIGLPVAAYLLTVYPGVGDRQGTGDAVEYQLVGRILSIPHEPGYPQYVLLSHLWSYLPIPVSLATRINLLSTVFTALAGLLFYSAAKSFSGDLKASILATWLVLLSPDVWLVSTQAEVYTLNLMWVSVVLWAALSWHRTGQQRFLVALFFAYALSFGNHLTMVTLLPGLAFLVLAKEPRVVLRWQNWLWAGVAILVGLLQYGLLVWRSYHPHPALLSRFPLRADTGDLLGYITGQHFVDRHLLKTGIEGWLPRVWEALGHSATQLTLPFALVCAFGAYLSLRRQRQLTLFLVVVSASVLAFAAAYGIKDSLLYTMPAWFCAGLLGALGLGRFFESTRRWRLQIGVLTIALVAGLLAWRGPQLAVQDNPTDLESVIEVAPPGSGILAAFKPRRARLLRLYYQYGQITEKALLLDFFSVEEALATGLEDVGDRTLYFRDPRAARRMEGSLIDYRVIKTLADGHTVYVNEPQEPLERLELRPLWNGTLAIAMRERSIDLLGDQTLHLFLVSARHRRSKGYLSLDTHATADWPERLADALAVASFGDRFLLVAPRLGQEAQEALASILDAQSIDLRALPAARRHTIAWWRVGGAPEDLLLEMDLSTPLVLRLEPRGAESTRSPSPN